MAVRRSTIEVASHWGCVTKNQLLAQDPAAACLAVLFPGDNYPCAGPLLHYPRKAALLAGCDVLSLEYGYQVTRVAAEMDEAQYVVDEAAAAVLRARQPSHRRLLFISKSLGTLIAGQVADRFGNAAVSHVYLTPIALSLPYLLRSSGTAFTGTADPHFGAAERQRLAENPMLNVVAIPGVGHSLEREDDWAGSLQILSQVCELTAQAARLQNPS